MLDIRDKPYVGGTLGWVYLNSFSQYTWTKKTDASFNLLLVPVTSYKSEECPKECFPSPPFIFLTGSMSSPLKQISNINWFPSLR